MQIEQENRESVMPWVNKKNKNERNYMSCDNFADSVEFYHHECRHTKVDNSIVFFP